MRALRVCCAKLVLAAAALSVCWSGCGTTSSAEAELVRAMRTGRTAEARRQALLKLQDRARPWMRQELESVLEYELDAATRALAAQALGATDDPDAVAALRRSVRTDASPVVRERALAALARLLGPEIGEDLEQVMYAEPAPEVVVRALELARQHLADGYATRLIGVLVGALEHVSPAVRLRAHTLLKEVTGLSAAPTSSSWRGALEAERAGRAEETPSQATEGSP
ncbi:MAG: HEAT repeat domain-containing protein [Candidatus Brocadiae bacterium]|nr:HEAT repeat domain-containing protein [Candidatus Brocadiia bacterium]